MKFRFSPKGADLKGLLVKHVEKIVLTVVVLLAAWLVVAGYGRETPDRTQTPESISQLADTARNSISNSNWTQVKDDRMEKLFFSERAQLIAKTVGLTPYQTTGFNPPTAPPETKRVDPELYPASDLVARAVVAPMAELMSEEERLLREEEEEEEFGGDLFGAGGEAGEQRKRLTTEDQQKLQGQGRGGGGMGFGRGGGGGISSGDDTKLVRTQFVSITAMVPARQQDDEYKRCFLNAEEYDQSRDHPRYIFYYVRKREILPDGSTTEWERVSTNEAIRRTYDWGNADNEVAHPDYVHTMLTYPLPPVLILDPDRFGRHPEVPQRPDTDRHGGLGAGYEGYDGGPGQMQEGEGGDDLPNMQEFNQGGPGGEFGPAGGGMRPGRGGFGRGPGGQGTGKDIGIEDPDAEKEKDARPKRRRYGAFTMGGGLGRGGTFELAADHYMFRFADFEVEQGKSYQYQVRLMLEDPNDPFDLTSKPSQRSMAMKVIERLREKPKRDPKRPRKAVFYRLTEWSEPSPAVYVPSGTLVLAGAPRKQAVIKVDDDNSVPRDEPVMNVMMVSFDEDDGYLMAAEQAFRRGAVVNFNKRVNAVNPLDFTVESRDFEFTTDQLLADVLGGQTLPVSPGNEAIISVGEMLLMDARGNLDVRTEVDDFDNYDRYVFEDPKEEGGGAAGGFGVEGGGFDAKEPGARRRRANRRRP